MLRSFLLLFACCVVVCLGKDENQCSRNEELRCVNSCPPEKSCRNRNIRFSCLAVHKPCQNKCVCKDGYFRNFLGDCITGEQCDQCSKQNEFFDCGSACDNECSTLFKQNRTNCPLKNIVCNPKCYCQDGFARDDKGNCVPEANCSPLQKCEGPNEEYAECKSLCPPETCMSIVAKFKCDSEQPCQPRCVCKPGFLRIKDKSPCVPICECPEMKNSPDCQKS